MLSLLLKLEHKNQPALPLKLLLCRLFCVTGAFSVSYALTASPSFRSRKRIICESVAGRIKANENRKFINFLFSCSRTVLYFCLVLVSCITARAAAFDFCRLYIVSFNDQRPALTFILDFVLVFSFFRLFSFFSIGERLRPPLWRSLVTL